MVYTADGSEKAKEGLHRPFHFAGTETPCADSHAKRFAAANVGLDAPKIDKPTPARMPVRVAYGISGDRPATATFTYFCH